LEVQIVFGFGKKKDKKKKKTAKSVIKKRKRRRQDIMAELFEEGTKRSEQRK